MRKNSEFWDWVCFWIVVVLIIAFLVIGILKVLEKVEEHQYEWQHQLQMNSSTATHGRVTTGYEDNKKVMVAKEMMILAEEP